MITKYFLYANKFLFENMGNKILNTGLPEISAMISIAHSKKKLTCALTYKLVNPSFLIWI